MRNPLNNATSNMELQPGKVFPFKRIELRGSSQGFSLNGAAIMKNNKNNAPLGLGTNAPLHQAAVYEHRNDRASSQAGER